MAYALGIADGLKARLDEAAKRGLGRNPVVLDAHGQGPLVTVGGKKLLSFISNDYLGLACNAAWNAEVARAFAEHAPSSSGSRLAGGHSTVIARAEQEAAAYFGYDECLFLPSGYQGNAALVATLAQPGTPILTDRRIHASTGNALKGLHNADIRPFAHQDLGHLERRLLSLAGTRQPLVLVESLYSMDGTLSDVQGLAHLKKRHGFFLAVDEAHAVGCLGPEGRGVFAQYPGTADVALGTLGKGLGFFGSFLLLPRGFSRAFEHLASPIMHSTELPPAHAAAVATLIRLLPKLSATRARLADNAATFRRLLDARGLIAKGDAHIVAVPIGNEAKAARIAKHLLDEGILVLAARFPTVPWGNALLRFGITALHDTSMLVLAADATAEAFAQA